MWSVDVSDERGGILPAGALGVEDKCHVLMQVVVEVSPELVPRNMPVYDEPHSVVVLHTLNSEVLPLARQFDMTGCLHQEPLHTP